MSARYRPNTAGGGGGPTPPGEPVINFRQDGRQGHNAHTLLILEPRLEPHGSNVVQVRYDLVSSRGSVALGSSGAWVTPNAVHGRSDGSVASMSRDTQIGGLNRNGSIDGRYNAITTKDDFTITRVQLACFYRFVRSTAAPPMTLRINPFCTDFDVNAVEISHTALSPEIDENMLSTPLLYDMTSLRTWTWANLADLFVQIYGAVSASTAVGAGDFIQVDANELRVTAQRTEVL